MGQIKMDVHNYKFDDSRLHFIIFIYAKMIGHDTDILD